MPKNPRGGIRAPAVRGLAQPLEIPHGPWTPGPPSIRASLAGEAGPRKAPSLMGLSRCHRHQRAAARLLGRTATSPLGSVLSRVSVALGRGPGRPRGAGSSSCPHPGPGPGPSSGQHRPGWQVTHGCQHWPHGCLMKLQLRASETQHCRLEGRLGPFPDPVHCRGPRQRGQSRAFPAARTLQAFPPFL